MDIYENGFLSIYYLQKKSNNNNFIYIFEKFDEVHQEAIIASELTLLLQWDSTQLTFRLPVEYAWFNLIGDDNQVTYEADIIMKTTNNELNLYRDLTTWTSKQIK